MSPLPRRLLGPELYWLVVYGATRLLAVLNRPATDTGNRLLEQLGCWLLPLLSVPLSFWLFFGPHSLSSSRGWTLARLGFATLVGLNACLVHLVGAIDYRDSRNSGLLGVWALGAGLGTVLFCAGVVVLGILWWRARGG